MNNILKGSIILSMVALSGSLAAQTTQSDSLTQQTYPVTDSLRSEKTMAAGTRYNRLKLNPLSLLVNGVSTFYERALNKNTSVVVGYGMGGEGATFGLRLNPGGVAYQRVTLEVRQYWAIKQLTGFYAGPYVRWNRLTVNSFVSDLQGKPIRDLQGNFQTVHQQATIWAPGLMVGSQYIKKWFCLDVFLGFQRQIVVGSVATGNQVAEAMTNILALRMGLCVGVAF